MPRRGGSPCPPCVGNGDRQVGNHGGLPPRDIRGGRLPAGAGRRARPDIRAEVEDNVAVWSRIKQVLLFRVLWLVGTAILGTVRVRIVDGEKLDEVIAGGQGGLVLPWHGATMLPIYHYRNRGFYSIVSLSGDGELQDMVLRSRGFHTIRGSSGRQGARALLESVRCLRAGNVMAFSADSVKERALQVEPGVVYLAKRSGCPVLPVGVACRPCKYLASWDSHMLPLPFAKAMIAFGDPIRVSADDDDREAAVRIARAIDEAERRAENLLAGASEGT